MTPEKIDYGDGRVDIIHEINGKWVVVPTHGYDVGNTVTMLIDGEPVEVVVQDQWELHGEPCERRSRHIGGDGYERK